MYLQYFKVKKGQIILGIQRYTKVFLQKINNYQ